MSEKWEECRQRLHRMLTGPAYQVMHEADREAIREAMRRADQDQVEPGVLVKVDFDKLREVTGVELGKNVVTGAIARIEAGERVTQALNHLLLKLGIGSNPCVVCGAETVIGDKHADGCELDAALDAAIAYYPSGKVEDKADLDLRGLELEVAGRVGTAGWQSGATMLLSALVDEVEALKRTQRAG